MKVEARFVFLMLAGTAMAGCNSTRDQTGSIDAPIAPYADVYSATYAKATANAISQLLVKPGDKLEGGAATVDENFDTNARELSAPQKVVIEKASDGYVLNYGGQSVHFTNADKLSDGSYEQKMPNKNNEMRTIGYMFSTTTASTVDALAASDSSMVPLGFGVRTANQGVATADHGDAFRQGFTVVGAETDPSDMPKTGTATYKGYARVDAYNKVADYSKDSPDRVIYRGDSTINADFGAGTVDGSLDIKRSQKRTTINGSGPQIDISAAGASIALNKTDIVANGFSSDLAANAAAKQIMANDGITDDIEAKAVGRFYGTNAGQVGAIVAGDGSTHVVTGIITGDKTP